MTSRWRETAADIACYVAGSLFYGAGVCIFAGPAEFAPGGLTGVTLILRHLTGVPIGLATVLLNIPLVLLSLRVVGREFLIKSIRSIAVSSLFIDVLFPLLPVYAGSRGMAAVFAGLLSGMGLSLFYGRGSSTGGADFLLMSVKRFLPSLSVGSINMTMNLFVFAWAGFVFQDVDAVLLGFLSSLICSVILDSRLAAAKKREVVAVVTRQPAAVTGAIHARLGRGTTVLPAKGGYSGEDLTAVFCACTRAQTYRVRDIVYQADPRAFVMILEAGGVLGKGFLSPQGWQ